MVTTDMNDNAVSVFRGTAFLGVSVHRQGATACGTSTCAPSTPPASAGPTTTRELRIDATAPATSDSSAPALAADGDSSWRQTGQIVSLAAADASSGLAHTYYTLDGVQHDY